MASKLKSTAAIGFSLTTIWRIPAPINQVWDIMLDTQNWPLWWKYVNKVEEIKAGDVSGIGNVRRYYWSTILPYQLIFELCITALNTRRLITTRVHGDLRGSGFCRFSVRDNLTILNYQWDVELCKPWMQRIAPLARPVFIWNHRQVMQQGELSLIRRLKESNELDSNAR